MNQHEEILFTMPVLTASHVAAFLGHADRGTVDKWRQRDQGPAYFEIGDGEKPRIKYSLRDVILFAVAQG